MDTRGPSPRPAADPVRQASRKRVIDIIRERGPVARVEITDHTGLSPATVTSVTADLLDEGLIRLADVHGAAGETVGQPSRGRPRTLLEIEPDAGFAIGVKLSLDQISATLTNMSGEIIGTDLTQAPIDTMETADIVRTTADCIRAVVTKSGVETGDVKGVGVGVPGYVGYPEGDVHWSPLFDASPTPFRALLEAEIGLRAHVDNDANLIALAEKWFGVGRHHSSFLVVTVEHGVGMGLVVDNRLYRGSRGLGAEFGHTKLVVGGALCRCGQRGCIEAYVSDYAIVREASIFDGGAAAAGHRSMRDAMDALIARADGGDANVAAVFRRAGQYLGIGIANLVDVLDPAVVILSGARTHSAKAFFSALQGALGDANEAMPRPMPSLEIHPWGDEIWARGAAALVLDEGLV